MAWVVEDVASKDMNFAPEHIMLGARAIETNIK
jgi:hypothetical protein